MFTTENNPFDRNLIKKDELSMDDIMGLINKSKEEDVPTIAYDQEAIDELEEFCKEHGIVGFNCGNMNPRAALEILKKRVGNLDSVIKDYESQGWEVCGKDYSHKKELLLG